MFSLRSLVSTLTLSTLAALSAPAYAAGWDWEWELLPTSWVDDVIEWSLYVQDDYTGIEIKEEFMAPNASHWCVPNNPCDDAIVFKRWAHYFLDLPEQSPLPEPFPLGCTNDCLVED